MCLAVVNWAEEHRITCADDVNMLLGRLAGLPAFTVHVTGQDGERGATLDVIVESDRGLVGYLDIARGIKLASRNPQCADRDTVSLANEEFPDLHLDQIEVERRDLISRDAAMSILRHYLKTGEVIDLIRWPPDDGADEALPEEPRPFCDRRPCPPDEDIPF